MKRIFSENIFFCGDIFLLVKTIFSVETCLFGENIFLVKPWICKNMFLGENIIFGETYFFFQKCVLMKISFFFVKTCFLGPPSIGAYGDIGLGFSPRISNMILEILKLTKNIWLREDQNSQSVIPPKNTLAASIGGLGGSGSPIIGTSINYIMGG